MKQPPPALCKVLPAKHPAVFDFSQRLWLQLDVYVSESRVLLMEINQRVHLYNGVFNQTQRLSQVLVLICTSYKQKRKENKLQILETLTSYVKLIWTVIMIYLTERPSVLCRMRSTSTGYLVIRCVTNKIHSVTPNLRTMERLLIF